MVISKLKTPEKKESATFEEFVNKGAPVAPVKEEKENKKEITNFNIRLPKYLSAEIDKVLEDRVGISKTGWILEAIQEKLKRTE